MYKLKLIILSILGSLCCGCLCFLQLNIKIINQVNQKMVINICLKQLRQN